MPRHIRAPATSKAKYLHLVEELAAELRQSSQAIQPVILEDETPETGTLRVQVIWQKWDQVPYGIRTSVILDAYERVYGAQRRSGITLALGYDFWESKNVGLLPVSLQPRLLETSALTIEEYHRAMREVGAPVEHADQGPQLWFATIEDAEAVKDRLEQSLPGSAWRIIEETYREPW